ncbi:MAG: hypothetical protein ACTSQA_02465 [Candidatus Heimdallarchaeaceae archaeon]
MADSEGQTKTFFIEPSFDLGQREQVKAVLEKVSENAYFYLEKDWHENLTEKEKQKIEQSLSAIAKEFDEKIYPELTLAYGQEWKPGIDSDEHITILFHQMKENAGGYFNNGDEYRKIQNPLSNERSCVAHEFVHLITFNQKDRLRGVSEDIWLNEARADYAPTLLGYDEDYQGSNLQQRVRQFVSFPTDSVTEWKNEASDYGIVNIFTQYLVDHYGIEILADSLKSSKTGINSINEALEKNEIDKTFSNIFTDWAITVFVNDCSLGEEYCYKNQNLENLKITPSLIFLPSTQKTNVSLDYSIKQWSGNWYRVIGGQGQLKLEFNGTGKVDFNVPYVLCQNGDECSIDFLELNSQQDGEILLEDFGDNWTNLTLIPSIQSKISGFTDSERSYDFSLLISAEIENEEDEELIAQLEAIIAELQKQIIEITTKINLILQGRISGQKINQNLYLGMQNQQVFYLQEFLKNQGERTGFVGLSTRDKINQLISNN